MPTPTAPAIRIDHPADVSAALETLKTRRCAAALADDLAWVPVVQDLVAARVAPEELVPTLQRETPECYRGRFDDAGWLAVARLLLA